MKVIFVKSEDNDADIMTKKPKIGMVMLHYAYPPGIMPEYCRLRELLSLQSEMGGAPRALGSSYGFLENKALPRFCD